MRTMTPDEVAALLCGTSLMSYSAQFKARIGQDVNSGRRPRVFGTLSCDRLSARLSIHHQGGGGQARGKP